MKTRKIILAALDLILAVVLIVQLASGAKDTTKMIVINDEITKVEIQTSAEIITVEKNGSTWLVNGKYEGDTGVCDAIEEAVKSVRVIDTVAKSDNEDVLAKYDLQDGKAVSVKVYTGDKLAHTYKIGKNTSAQYQTYVTIDGGKDIYLAAGDYQEDLNTTISHVRSGTVWSLDKNDISMISLQNENGLITITRNADSWAVSGAEIDIDPDQAELWASACSTITATRWITDTDQVPGSELFRIDLKVGNSNKWIYVNNAIDAKDGLEVYFAKTSESSDVFELSSYFVNKLQKTAEELSR